MQRDGKKNINTSTLYATDLGPQSQKRKRRKIRLLIRTPALRRPSQLEELADLYGEKMIPVSTTSKFGGVKPRNNGTSTKNRLDANSTMVTRIESPMSVECTPRTMEKMH